MSSKFLENETGCVTFWDFAGQTVFQTTHQAFMSSKAVYLLVTDVSRPMTDIITDDDDCQSNPVQKTVGGELNIQNYDICTNHIIKQSESYATIPKEKTQVKNNDQSHNYCKKDKCESFFASMTLWIYQRWDLMSKRCMHSVLNGNTKRDIS
jgi:hypothetical protein